jgi:hypothetical protein
VHVHETGSDEPASDIQVLDARTKLRVPCQALDASVLDKECLAFDNPVGKGNAAAHEGEDTHVTIPWRGSSPARWQLTKCPGDT